MIGVALFLLMATQDVRSVETEGHAAIQNGRYREALRVFDSFLAAHAATAPVHYGRGLALSALARHEGAIEALEAAIALEPGMVAAHYQYARSLETLGQWKRAIDRYRVVLELNPYHRSARYRLGSVLLRAGSAEDAERLLRGYEPFRLWDHQVRLLRAMLASDALVREDRKQKTFALVELLLDGGDTDAAESLLEAADYREESRFIVLYARWLMLTGRVSDARAMLDPVAKASATDRDALWLSAQLHMREGRQFLALADYEALLTLWSEPPARVHQEAGTAFAVNGRLQDAITQFGKALVAEPRLARVHADLGLALARAGRREEAEAHYREALEIRPSLIAGQQGLASVLLVKGDTLGALALFQQSVALNPRSSSLRQNLALALHRAGRIEAAAAELQKARELESRKPD